MLISRKKTEFSKLNNMNEQLELPLNLPAKVQRKRTFGKNSYKEVMQMIENPRLFTPELSRTDTLAGSINTGLITHNYMQLSYLYVNNGLIATAIENPINDAFSKGFNILSEDFSSQDIKEIMSMIEKKEIIDKIKEAMTWQSLFGGGALVIARENDESAQRIFSLDKGEDFELFPVNRWQLNFNPNGYMQAAAVGLDVDSAEYFWLANEKINAKNIIILKGKKAPFMVSQNLSGWGMSEVERMIKDLNIHTKTRQVLFEIIDESKIDVFQIDGFMDALIGNQAQAMLRRIEMQNKIKNYKNALVMDAKDNYSNKQNTFTGLSEVAHQNRIDIAAALRQPVVKLFGTSPAGFSSSEEEFNQYYQLVESGARQIAKRVLRRVISLCANSLFGFSPNFDIDFPPFKVLSEKEIEEIKTMRIGNAAQLMNMGAIDSLSEHLKKIGVDL